MALSKLIEYKDQNNMVLAITSYHIIASVIIDYKAPGGGNIVAIVQSYVDKKDRDENLHNTRYRLSIPLAGHDAPNEFFLNIENENVLQKCYEALKQHKIFLGAQDA